MIDSYPQSQFRADAKLGLGDTYLGERSGESYVLAINEFREFLNFYPTHDRAHYAQFKLAMAHFYQMRAPMRDQTETRDAIRELQSLRLQVWRQAAHRGGDVQSCARRRTGSTTGTTASPSTTSASSGIPARSDAWSRCSWPTPNTPAATRPISILGESLIKVNKQAEALPYFERLVKEFEQSEYLEKAKARITELKALPAAPGKGSRP